MKISLSEHFDYKKLLKFTAPTMIMMLFNSIYGVVDGVFVSNFVGKDAFTAVNLTFPVLIMIASFGFMVGNGGSALISKTLGEKNLPLARKYFSMLVLFIIMFLFITKPMKKILTIFLSLFAIFGFTFAQEYVYFYGNGCSHCAKVEKFFEKEDIEKIYNIDMREIYFNRDNVLLFQEYIEKLEIDPSKAGVPFLVINNENECNYVAGDNKIISFFQEKIDAEDENFKCNPENCPDLNCSEIDTGDVQGTVETDTENHRSFFGVMIPAALADSINPCAFAVILLLLSSILIETKDRKKALLAGFLFALAVFLSYLAMGLGLFSALATATNTVIIKWIVGILGIIVGLANMKDFFWYGEGFRMEVPLARRPTMHKIIKKATSPVGAFVVGFLVSLFLLPCTSGPYITILGYLASESSSVSTWGLIYLIVYNLIFILPMIGIALLVGFGVKSAEELAAFRHKNVKLIHLIVGLLMLGLGIYVLVTM